MKRHGGNINALLSERIRSEKAACCMIPTIGHSGKDRTMETVKRSVVARGWGEGGGAQRIFRAVKPLCMTL